MRKYIRLTDLKGELEIVNIEAIAVVSSEVFGGATGALSQIMFVSGTSRWFKETVAEIEAKIAPPWPSQSGI
jgi:hypothetical protein